MAGTDDLQLAIRARAHPLRTAGDLDRLIERLGSARVVMLGEASHGTHEFYAWRAEISLRLIREHGFRFIAVEGDWPPGQALDSYLKLRSRERAEDALQAFHRWPTWMWGNREVASLARRLRDHNATLPPDQRVGFHGLDVYSLFESLDAVIAQLEEVNPILARRARVRYECFLPFRRDERRYARSLLEFPAGCQEQVIANLKDLLAARLRARAGADADEALFDAEQNARVVRNAEDYYRTMVHGTEDSWNVRDRHMQETLELLLERYDARLGAGTRAIVWAHNTHIGDYRATDMLRMGQVNLGGLARERLGEGAVALVGFSTYEGSVIASPAWDGPIQRLPVPPGRHGSWDAALHEAALAVGSSTFWSIFDPSSRRGPLGQNRGQRAIGVVYDPEHERWGNYVPTSLARRYDCLVHVDRTRALEPIPIGFDREELPETWPAGF